jgi:hypothetical protein
MDRKPSDESDHELAFSPRACLINAGAKGWFHAVEIRVVTGPMMKAEQYRAKAEECERLARGTRDPDIKLQLEKLASQWRDMANWVQGNKQ